MSARSEIEKRLVKMLTGALSESFPEIWAHLKDNDEFPVKATYRLTASADVDGLTFGLDATVQQTDKVGWDYPDFTVDPRQMELPLGEEE